MKVFNRYAYSYLTRSLLSQFFPGCHALIGLLPRCQLVMSCGAGERLSYMYEYTPQRSSVAAKLFLTYI